MRYRLIALDLDGTLLSSDGTVSPANRDAIARAQEAGVIVAPCTGRAWHEAKRALARVPNLGHGIFVTGASVCDVPSGSSLDMALIEPHLVLRIVQQLAAGPEAVLVFQERQITGCDYLVTGRGELTPNTRWWFEATGASVTFQQDVTADNLHHTLRIGVVTSPRRMRQITARLQAAFDGQIYLHSFQAVPMPDPTTHVHVLEIFGLGVDKWRGIQWLAEQHAIAPEQIAVIGDEINDVSMIRAAGCGIAMGNAVAAARQHARHITRDNDHAGVAHAIDQMLAGAW